MLSKTAGLPDNKKKNSSKTPPRYDFLKSIGIAQPEPAKKPKALPGPQTFQQMIAANTPAPSKVPSKNGKPVYGPPNPGPKTKKPLVISNKGDGQMEPPLSAKLVNGFWNHLQEQADQASKDRAPYEAARKFASEHIFGPAADFLGKGLGEVTGYLGRPGPPIMMATNKPLPPQTQAQKDAFKKYSDQQQDKVRDFTRHLIGGIGNIPNWPGMSTFTDPGAAIRRMGEATDNGKWTREGYGKFLQEMLNPVFAADGMSSLAAGGSKGIKALKDLGDIGEIDWAGIGKDMEPMFGNGSGVPKDATLVRGADGSVKYMPATRAIAGKTPNGQIITKTPTTPLPSQPYVDIFGATHFPDGSIKWMPPKVNSGSPPVIKGPKKPIPGEGLIKAGVKSETQVLTGAAKRKKDEEEKAAKAKAAKGKEVDWRKEFFKQLGGFHLV